MLMRLHWRAIHWRNDPLVAIRSPQRTAELNAPESIIAPGNLWRGLQLTLAKTVSKQGPGRSGVRTRYD